MAKDNGAAERIQLVVALEKAGVAALYLGKKQEGLSFLDEAVQVSRRDAAAPSPALMGGEPLMLVAALHMAAIPAMDYNRLDTAAANLDEARALLKNPPSADRLRENWRELVLTILARRAEVELLRANPASFTAGRTYVCCRHTPPVWKQPAGRRKPCKYPKKLPHTADTP